MFTSFQQIALNATIFTAELYGALAATENIKQHHIYVLHSLSAFRTRSLIAPEERTMSPTGVHVISRALCCFEKNDNRPFPIMPALTALRFRMHIPEALARVNASLWRVLSSRRARGRMGNLFPVSRCMARFFQTVYCESLVHTSS